MSAKHRLIDGRAGRFTTGEPKTHIVGDGPPDALDTPVTLCGKHPSGLQHTGPVSKVTCERCLASLRRQKEAVR